MVYTDLIFILGIFPITALLSFFDRSAEYKNLILIITSLLFFSWGRPFVVCLIFISLLWDWALANSVEKTRKSQGGAGFFVFVDLAVNLMIFLIFGHNYVFRGTGSFSLNSSLLPIGIGFYTLRGFSYVYDVYKGKIKAEKNVFCFMTYMVSYHLMLTGPAVRYGDIEPQIRHREVTTQKINEGLVKIFLGFSKVVLLAGVFETIKLAGLNGMEITTEGCWLGMISFFLQYYFLFTGYCDMSKGLGLVNGFTYPDNYTDINPDGLFTGLVKSFNTTVVSFFGEVFGLDKERSKVYTAIMYVICGGVIALWYGVKLNFLIVGSCAGVLVALEKLFLEKPLSKLPSAIKYIYLFAASLLIFGGLYFDTFHGYVKWLSALVGAGTVSNLSSYLNDFLMKNLTLAVIALFIFLPFLKKAVTKLCGKIASKGNRGYGFVRVTKTILTAFVFALSVITLVVENAAA